MCTPNSFVGCSCIYAFWLQLATSTLNGATLRTESKLVYGFWICKLVRWEGLWKNFDLPPPPLIINERSPIPLSRWHNPNPNTGLPDRQQNLVRHGHIIIWMQFNCRPMMVLCNHSLHRKIENDFPPKMHLWLFSLQKGKAFSKFSSWRMPFNIFLPEGNTQKPNAFAS